MQFHPLADMFPLLEGEEAALTESIGANGLREAIVLHPDGSILDGRNRYRACIEAGVEPHFRIFGDRASDGDDPRAFVISANIERRHLNPSQRALIVARFADMSRGARTDLAQTCAMSDADAAKRGNISERQVEYAKRVLRECSPDVVARIDRGECTVSNALTEKRREDKIAGIAATAKLTALNEFGRKFPVLYADPPWQFEHSVAPPSRAVENQYPTMSLDEICAQDVESVAAEDCVLFLWSSATLIRQALTVVKRWGFEYLACMVWDKVHIGLGHWVRGQHEILLIARRGNMKCG